MNVNTTFGRLLTGLALISLLGACDKKDDPTPPDVPSANRTATQEWIESTLREHYLWFSEIPASANLDYSLDDEPFFTSLLSSKDGYSRNGTHHYFSYMDKITPTRNFIEADYSYGFEFAGLRLSKEGKEIAAVLYVLPGSPAEEAGLRRGDWILTIDGKKMTTDDELKALLGGPACTLSIGREPTLSGGRMTFGETVDNLPLPAARAVDDNPVFMHKVITTPGGTKVGYLVYNEFEAGPSGKAGDTAYDEQLRRVSNEFLDNGVSEVVLDLRYNNGGLITSGILLCSILQPAAQLGQRLGYLEYNTKHSPRKSYFTTNAAQYLKSGSNLNLRRLFVLTSSTTASASEMVINCLRPFMEVTVIGQTTVGKNVGSEPYTDDTDTWEMHPIVCKLTNSEDFGDYSAGFPPSSGQTLSEMYQFDNQGYVISVLDMLPLGDTNERLLQAALQAIDPAYATSATLPTRSTPDVAGGGHYYLPSAFNSLARKATAGVVITPVE
ncbi:MAG: PDZ domain-containing protein [Prevotellaceae bacterium]|jgi:C-terminal processing protease CtpA/Prc|nr:PDZ domain-containing protein [Prevotellaceae bacterium]